MPSLVETIAAILTKKFEQENGETTTEAKLIYIIQEISRLGLKFSVQNKTIKDFENERGVYPAHQLAEILADFWVLKFSHSQIIFELLKLEIDWAYDGTKIVNVPETKELENSELNHISLLAEAAQNHPQLSSLSQKRSKSESSKEHESKRLRKESSSNSSESSNSSGSSDSSELSTDQGRIVAFFCVGATLETEERKPITALISIIRELFPKENYKFSVNTTARDKTGSKPFNKIEIIHTDQESVVKHFNYAKIGILDNDEEIPQFMRDQKCCLFLRFDYKLLQFVNLTDTTRTRLKNLLQVPLEISKSLAT